VIVRADALRIPLAERSVDLVIGSPPPSPKAAATSPPTSACPSVN
jgi:hypothetical protein